MPKISLFLEQVVAIASSFLKTINQHQVAQKLQSQYPLPEWIKHKNPILKKGLKKLLKDYINQDEQMLQYYTNRKQQVSQKKQSKHKDEKASKNIAVQSPKIDIKKQEKKPVGWMNKFTQPKRLQDLNQIEDIAIEQQVDIPKKQKKDKKKKAKQIKKKELDSSDMQSEQQFELQKKQKKQKKGAKHIKPQIKQSSQSQSQQIKPKSPKTKVKKVKVQEKQVAQQLPQKKKVPNVQVQNNTWQTSNFEKKQNSQNFSLNGYKNFFSRINKDQVGPISEQLRDNSFHAKAKYGGGGDVWGQYGYQKLKDTRGDSFKKTKGKLKNKAFQGSGIDINRVNSIPIL